jgi:hypothetical protein
VPYGREISRDGFKLLLEFCKTFRRGGRLVRCAGGCPGPDHVRCLATIVPPGKRAAGTGQNQKQKHENGRGARCPLGNGWHNTDGCIVFNARGWIVFNTYRWIVFDTFGRVVFQEKTRSATRLAQNV